MVSQGMLNVYFSVNGTDNEELSIMIGLQSPVR